MISLTQRAKRDRVSAVVVAEPDKLAAAAVVVVEEHANDRR
jgi:hypothetical protein